jgi:hypothetical protein
MKKWLPRIAYLALFLLVIGIFLLIVFLLWNPNCDGFACLGFIFILLPFFLFGIGLLGIWLLATLGFFIYSKFYKQQNGE